MKFGLRYEFTWKCMYAGWICYLRNYGLLLCSYSNALNEYPISSSLSHDDCCVYPHPEKVRIQHSQTWPAFSVVEYQQVHLKFLIKFVNFLLLSCRLQTYGLYEVRVSGNGNYQVSAIKRMQSNKFVIF
ncbi:hypothetical protein C1H46_020418 [Malus baccata]|uniref:Uncharacterized protein n=1 Tax=Malus baccata TaxID=106549 RepID=A0A540M5G5_MALBA|nr:hypothetical protein C1H46_020418 [Malus baccata]